MVLIIICLGLLLGLVGPHWLGWAGWVESLALGLRYIEHSDRVERASSNNAALWRRLPQLFTIFGAWREHCSFRGVFRKLRWLGGTSSREDRHTHCSHSHSHRSLIHNILLHFLLKSHNFIWFSIDFNWFYIKIFWIIFKNIKLRETNRLSEILISKLCPTKRLFFFYLRKTTFFDFVHPTLPDNAFFFFIFLLFFYVRQITFLVFFWP